MRLLASTTHARAGDDRDSRGADRGEHPEVLRAEAAAAGDHDRAGAHVFADRADVFAGGDRLAQLDEGGAALGDFVGVFGHQDRVGAFGQRGAGGDSYRLIGGEGA
jgi:hypothetical protein